jgi:hypothetical protein
MLNVAVIAELDQLPVQSPEMDVADAVACVPNAAIAAKHKIDFLNCICG